MTGTDLQGPLLLDLPRDVVEHYELGNEHLRLERGRNRLEFVRTCEIIEGRLPAAPDVIIDVGGGTGRYAHRLADLGYAVQLVDPISGHVQQAQQWPSASGQLQATLGDARALPVASESAGAVLELGPLYHLLESADRALCLREAYRVLRPGGVVFAVSINRFVCPLQGVFLKLFQDPVYVELALTDLATGRHLPPPGSNYFATAYFHRPEELADEVAAAGFEVEALLAVEGPFWLLPNFDDVWSDPSLRDHLLDLSRRFAAEPTLLGASCHVLCIGRKPG